MERASFDFLVIKFEAQNMYIEKLCKANKVSDDC